MRRRFILVRNQHAGTGHHALTDQVVRVLIRRSCDVVPAEGLPHTLLTDASELEAFDAVIAAGGDGTVRHLLAGQAGQAIPIGLIPAGTGNVLAEEIGLPRSAEILADTLIAGPSYPARVGRLNEELFLSMAGVGFDARIVRKLNLDLKRSVGKVAYALPTLAALLGRQPLFDVEVDGHAYTASWLVATKIRYYAGRFVIAPDAKLTDGKFTIVLFGSRSRWKRLLQLLALSLGAVERAPSTTVIEGSSVTVGGAGQGLPLQVDGDSAGWAPTEITMEGSIRLIVPSRYVP